MTQQRVLRLQRARGLCPLLVVSGSVLLLVSVLVAVLVAVPGLDGLLLCLLSFSAKAPEKETEAPSIMSGPSSVALPNSGMRRGGATSVYVPPGQTRLPLPSVPKVHYVPPNAGVTSSAWTAAGTFLDFEIPKGVGVLHRLCLRLDINNTNATLTIPPSPFLIQTIECYIGSQLIETLYPNDIYNETVGFLRKDEVEAESSVLLYQNNNTPAETHLVARPGNFTAYIPFNNALSCCKFFCDGVTETIKFRVYFPAGMFNTTQTSLGSANLVVEEDAGTLNDRKRWAAASSTGTVYSTVCRQRMNTTILKSNTTDYTLELTGVSGSSAGFLVYAGPVVTPGQGSTPYVPKNAPAPYDPVSISNNGLLPVRYSIYSLELDDQMGNKRTETLRGDHLISFVWTDQVGTSFPALQDNNVYPLSFCADFRDAVTTGIYQGHLRTNGRDRLIINANSHNPGLTTDTWSFTVTNYLYQALVIRGNKLVEILKNPHANDMNI